MNARFLDRFQHAVPALVSGAFFCAPSAFAGGFAPESYGIERYEHIWKKSPFIKETQIIQASDGLEKRFAITGIAQIGEKQVVFLLDRNSLSTTRVSSGEPAASGVELVTVAQNADARQSSATIRLGAEQAVVRFDPNMLATGGAQPAPQPPNFPAAAGSPPPVPRPVTPPGAAVPTMRAPLLPPQVPATNQVTRRRTIKLP